MILKRLAQKSSASFFLSKKLINIEFINLTNCIMRLTKITWNKIAFLLFVLANTTIILDAQTTPNTPYPQLLYPAFSKSIVKMKTGETSSFMLNYNMVDEEMLIDQQGVFRVLEHTENIDTIYINNHKFVPVGNSFYEVLVTGHISMYIQHKSRFSTAGTPTAYGMTSQTNATTKVTTMRSGNQVRNLEVPDNLIVSPATVYWVRVKNEMQKFTNERQFLKVFPEYEADIKGYIKTNKLNFKTSDDLIKLGNYCKTLIKN